MNKTIESHFEAELRNQILKAIRALRADGTCDMSVENLRQVVQSPDGNLRGAPRGTNTGYYYAEMFRRICAETKSIASFCI